MRRAFVPSMALLATALVASACAPKSPGVEAPPTASATPSDGAREAIPTTTTGHAEVDSKAADARATDAKAADSKAADAKAADAKAADAKAEASVDGGEPVRGAHAVPPAYRDDLGTPGQERPLNVIAAFVAAVDSGDREAAAALMTEGCAERERSWSKSFSKAIFERGLRLHAIKLRDQSSEGDRADVRLGVVFLDASGEPDNEGMSFTLVRRGDRWWIDGIR